MDDYPTMIVPPITLRRAPRRIRAVLAGEVVVDTAKALYASEWPDYPQYYTPGR